MPRKGHSDEQITTTLRQVEAGKKIGDFCRERAPGGETFPRPAASLRLSRWTLLARSDRRLSSRYRRQRSRACCLKT